MPWRGVFSVLLLVLWIPGLVTCEKDANTCSFYYWRVNWRTAVRQCELENKQLLCYKSKQEIDDITDAFRLAAFNTAKLELWLSSRNCSSTKMEECLSLHIQKSDSTVWHYFQDTCDGETYPFVCCVNGAEQSSSTEYIEYITTTTQKKTSDVFELTETSLQTTTYVASTSKFPMCKRVLRRGVWWPDTEVGKTAVERCPGNLAGMARWACESGSEGRWKKEGPDMTQCRSREIQNLKEKFNSSSASDIISELEHIFKDNETQVFGEDLADVISMMSDLPDRLFQQVESLSSSARWNLAETSVSKTMSVLNRMVEFHETWQDIHETERSKVGTRLLSTVDGMGSVLADSMPENQKEKSIDRQNMALQVMKPTFGESISMPQGNVIGHHSHLGNIILKEGYDSQLKLDDGNISLVFVLYMDMANILSPVTEKGKNQTASLNSAVLSTSVTQGRKPKRINNEVRIVMEHLIPNPNQSACAFWNVNRNQWDTAGCRLDVIRSNATYSECVCNHLTNFALLMDYGNVLKDVDQDLFHYITVIGCSLSIICLFFCIIIFTFSSYKSRHSWGLRYVIHRNLCLCLLVANVVLVAGLEKTSNERLCALIAGLLHYFFLAAFSWMFLEAVHIYLLLVVVFASRRSHSEKFYMFGYGFPAIIVVITAFARSSDYGTGEICWLSAENGTIWAFMGPVAVILILNTAALILAQYKASRISVKDDKVALLKRWLRVTLILFPVLGITWIFGFLYFGKYFEVAGLLFAIFNSFQGVCIFVFHCLMDKKARNMVVDSFKKKNTSINTGSSGTQKKMKERPQNGTKSNSITPVENDDINKNSRIHKAFQLADKHHCKKDCWSKWRKPWSFCFDMPVTNKDKNSCNKVQEGSPQAIIVQWNALSDKNCS